MELKDIKKPQLYPIKAISEQTGIPMVTLYRMIKSGRIKASNIAKSGKRPIYAMTAEAVQAYYDNLSNSTDGTESEHEPDISGISLEQAKGDEGQLP